MKVWVSQGFGSQTKSKTAVSFEASPMTIRFAWLFSLLLEIHILHKTTKLILSKVCYLRTIYEYDYLAVVNSK